MEEMVGKEKRGINILHIITRLILGGAQENTLYTVEGLMRKGYQVLLATGPPLGPEGSLVDKAKDRGIPLVMIDHLRREINPLHDFPAFWALYRLIKEGNFAIVHTHSSKAGILGRLAAKLAGVPVVIHTIHGLPFHPYQSRVLNLLYILAERMAGNFTDRIITVCEVMAQKAEEAGVASRDKLATIYSGMELDSFLEVKEDREKKKAQLGIKPGELVVGKVARLFPLKGHEYFLEAAREVVKELPRTKFLLVGDGILREDLRRKAEELGIGDKVIFAGLVEQKEIPAMIALMDVVVHASLREGLARVIPQALAEEKPVVTFDIDGASEIIEEGKNGFLIPPGDYRGMARAIIKLLKNRKKAREMGRYGRGKVDPKFRVETMVEEIEALYHQILKEKGKEI